MWVKTNKRLVFGAAALIAGYYLLRSLFGVSLLGNTTPLSYRSSDSGMAVVPDSGGAMSYGSSSGTKQMSETGLAPSTSPNRVVISESNISLLVSDVRQTGDEIVAFAEGRGGYMVSTSYSRPNESPFATITVRVPSKDLTDALNYLRSLGIKVTNENLVGKDVTDQYTDIESRMATLERTKTKFERILDSAVTVQDILTVQRELINLQSQIDALKGQKMAIEQDANLTKITLYLSTDELALPYTPDNTFRPAVIFKMAVRSLVESLRGIAEKIIWLGVYSVIWLPLLMAYLIYRRFRSTKHKLG